MRDPIPAGPLFGTEPDLPMNRAAQAVQGAAFDGVVQALWIHHEAAVMRAHDPLRPDVAGLSIHFDLGDLRHNGLAAERVRDTASRQNVAVATGFRRWP